MSAPAIYRPNDSDGFAKIAWLDQVLADPKVSFKGFAVGYVIAMRFSHHSEGPDLETLAQHLGRSVRSTHDAIRRLVEAGYITKRRGGGGRPNQHRIIMKGEA